MFPTAFLAPPAGLGLPGAVAVVACDTGGARR
jgi:hypothetical protein